ncbi:hypothetical protein [Arthrobacter pityocampae]|uniref:hypothetical protein n=1 Tax=Arthrobacter pityocampae TaxID=547334 RepID=UPI0037362814
MTSGPQPTHDPRYDGIYQRGGGTDAAARTALPAPAAPERPPLAEPSGPGTTVIREVAPEPGGHGYAAAAPRNPYDPWIWGVAGILVALGVYLLAAPLIHAEAYAEAMTAVQAGPYSAPWFTYTSLASPVLLLAGVSTAVAQLFVHSIRHTLRTR